MRLSSFLLPALLVASPAMADDGWRHTVALYGIGASIDGTAGVGPVTGDVDVGFSDILDNLEFGGMAAYRGEYGRWAVVGDLIYMDLENKKDGVGPFGNTRATVQLDQLVMELDGSYAATDRLDVYAGLRYWDVDSTVKVAGGGPLGADVKGSLSDDWVDLIYGLRYAWPLGDKWTLVARGDIAPFGIGSEFSWHATAYADWHPGDHAHVLVGYRYLNVNYENGSGANFFRMDVGEGGPTVGFAWTF